jgi:hypothetical protein
MHILTNISVGRRFGLNLETSSVGPNQGRTLDAEGAAAAYDAFWMQPINNSTLLDGQWHVLRYHTQIRGSQIFHEVWIDGVYHGSKGPAAMLAGASQNHFYVELGANMNQSPGQTQNYWWGKVSIWTSNPGW